MKRYMEIQDSNGNWKYDSVEYPGKLIVLEGMDGTGKSTLTQALSEKLNELKTRNNYNIKITNEPGATAIGKKLKQVINTTTTIDYVTDFLLFAGCRNENINKIIKPSLSKGDIIISDRYVYSSLVYQGLMNDDYERIYDVHKKLDLILVPDILFILTLDPKTALQRISSDDKFEQNNTEYFEKIQNYYVTKSPEWAVDGCKHYIINCDNKSKEEITSDLLAKILLSCKESSFLL